MATRLSAAFDLLTRGADKAAADTDRVGNSAERTGHKVDGAGRSMRLLGSVFADSSSQALGPLQEIVDKFEVMERAGESATTKIGGKLLGLGAAGIGVGSFLASLHSREQAAAQQLDASITQAGGSLSDYSGQIEKAVKSGEHFGYQASSTMDALNRLTVTTHSPESALKALSVAFDIAADKHITLAAAAEQTGLIFNGSARAGRQYGVVLTNTAGFAQALTKAQADLVRAGERVTSAQQSYNDKLAVYQQSTSHTLAQQLALYRSHQDLVRAQEASAGAADKVKAAQDRVAHASEVSDQNVARVGQRIADQAAAAANTFNGHLKEIGAKLEDSAGHFGKWGQDIAFVSSGVATAASLLELRMFSKLGKVDEHLGKTGTASQKLRDVQVATSAEGAAAVEGAAAKEVVALDSVGAAAVANGAKMTGLFGIVSRLAGPVGLGLLIGELGVLADKHLPKFLQSAPKITLPSANDYFVGSDGQLHPKDHSDGYVDAPRGITLTPHAPNLPDDYDAKNHATLTQSLASYGARAAAAAATAGTKVGKASGDGTLQGFLDSIGGGPAANAIAQAASAEAAKVAKQAAVDAATAIRDSVRAEFDKAKQTLADVTSQANNLRQSIAGSLRDGASILDVFGTGPNLNANHAFGSGQDFEKVKRYFEQKLATMRRFAAELSTLVHKGLDPALVAQLAQGGEAGMRVADALSGVNASEVGQLDYLTGQVNKISDATGKRISDVQFREQITLARKHFDVETRLLTEANTHLRSISRAKPGQVKVDQKAAAFLVGS